MHAPWCREREGGLGGPSSLDPSGVGGGGAGSEKDAGGLSQIMVCSFICFAKFPHSTTRVTIFLSKFGLKQKCQRDSLGTSAVPSFSTRLEIHHG